MDEHELWDKLRIARGLGSVTLHGHAKRSKPGVADCSRTRIGYTPLNRPRAREVADCSRTRIGYTASKIAAAWPSLRIARGLGSVTLAPGLGVHQPQLRIARGLGSVTLEATAPTMSSRLRIARGLGSVTLARRAVRSAGLLRIARGLGSVTLERICERAAARLRIARGLGSVTLSPSEIECGPEVAFRPTFKKSATAASVPLAACAFFPEKPSSARTASPSP